MSEMSYSAAIRLAMREEMRRDESVFLLGEDIGLYGGAFGVTAGLLEEFGPERIVESPISENSVVGLAVGAAMMGLRPIVEIMFMDFITLAADQLINHAAKLHYVYDGQVRVPLVVRAPAGGGRGYGASHSQTLESLFISTPGLKIVAPYTQAQARGLLKSAIREDSPVIFIEHKLLYGRKGEVPDAEECHPLGEAQVLRQGDDVTIVSWGRMLDVVGEALRGESAGVSAEVINLSTLAPMDMDTIMASVEKTGRLVVVEEGPLFGGVGGEIAASVAENCMEFLEGPVARVGAPSVPHPSARSLEAAMIPNAGDVSRAIEHTMSF